MYPLSFSSRSIAAQTMWTSGMLLVHALDPDRRGDEADERHRARACRLHGRDRRGARVAGREHRVEDDRVPLGEVVGQLHVVLDRLQRLLVAVEADEADARARDQRERRLRASRGPARRTGLTATFFPEIRCACIFSSGVSISTGSVGKSFVAS